MLSDYDRLLELTTAAEGAAGASNEQYQKTLESLESKLAKLDNAWTTFTTSLLDSSIYKTGIDALSGLLNVINELTSKLDGNTGFAKLGLLFAAIKTGDTVVKGFNKTMKDANNGGSVFGALGGGFKEVGKSINNTKTKLQDFWKSIKKTKSLTKEMLKFRKEGESFIPDFNTSDESSSSPEQQVESYKELLEIKKALFYQEGLSEEQQKIANALEGKNLSSLQATIAAKYNLVSANEIENLSEEQLNALKQKTILLDEAAANGSYSLALQKIILGAKSKLEAKGLGESAAAKRLDAIASKVAEGSTKSLAAATWSLVWPLLAVAAAVVLVVAAYNAIKNNSVEAKMERSKEAAESAASAAEEAANAYEELNDTLAKIEDHYENLRKLTKGTSEWKAEVKATNEEFLEMIDKYPELAELYEPDATGSYYVQKEGAAAKVQAVLDKYEQQEQNAKAAAAASNYRTKLIARDQYKPNESSYIDYSYLVSKENKTEDELATVQEWAVLSWMTNTEEFEEALSGGLIKFDSENKEWKGNVSFTYNGVEIDDLATILNNSRKVKVNEAFTASDVGRSRAEVVKQSGWTSSDRDAFIKTLSAQINSELSPSGERASKWQSSYINGENFVYDSVLQAQKEITPYSHEEIMDALQKAYGEGNVSRDKHNYYYTDENGEEQTIPTTEAAIQAATLVAKEQMKTNAENLPKVITEAAGKLEKTETGDALKRYFDAEEGGGLLLKDIEALMNDAEALEQIWAEVGGEEIYASELMQQHVGALYNEKEKLISEYEKLTGKQAENNEFMGRITVDSLRNYNEKLSSLTTQLGAEAAKSVDSLISSFVEDTNLSQEELISFQSQLFAIEDWTDLDDWENFRDTIESLNLKIPTHKLEEFTAAIIDAAKAVETLDLSTLVESCQSLTKVLEKLRSGELTRNVEEDDYKAIINADATLKKQFIETADGTYYFTGSLEKLQSVLERTTEDRYNLAETQVSERIKAGQVFEGKDWAASILSSLSNSTTGLEWSGYDLQLFDGLLKELKEKVDLDKLGIANLGNETTLEDIVNLDSTKRNAVAAALLEIYNNQMDDIVFGESEAFAILEAADSSIAAMQANKSNVGGLIGNEAAANMTRGAVESVLQKATETGISSAETDYLQQLLTDWLNAYEDYQNNKSYDNYQKAVAAKDALETATKELSNKTNFEKYSVGLEDAVSSLATISEELETITSQTDKINMVGAALGNLGIRVDESNIDKYSELIQMFTGGGENAILAYGQIIAEAAAANGIAEEQLAELFASHKLGEMSEELQNFGQLLVDNGFLMWKMTSNEETALAYDADLLSQIIDQVGTASDAWENSYTWIYNYTEQITALTREREKAERKFEKTLEDEVHTAAELRDITNEEISALDRRAEMANAGALKADQEIEKLFDKNSKFAKYVAYNRETGAITADYATLNTIKDKEFGEGFDEFMDDLEELRDTYQDAVDELEDIEDDLTEIYNRSRDDYSELIDEVQEALIASYQDMIDERTEVSSAIKEAQDAIVDRIQDQIDESRQARENEKTESDLADKRLRLAALMRDTSGGNAVEIATLRKEIEDAETDYTDSLVDQALERLQDANEKAAEQRDKQIEIAQAQLDAYNENDISYDDAQKLLDESLKNIDPNGIFGAQFENTKAGSLLSSQKDAMNKLTEEDWWTDINSMASNAWLFAKDGEDSLKAQIGSIKSKVENYSTALDTISGFFGEDGLTYGKGNEKTTISLKDLGNVTSSISETAQAILDLLNKQEDKKEEAEAESKDLYKADGRGGVVSRQPVFFDDYGNSSASYKKYASGGVADYTGPAWLDGSPTKPEMVLNPQDTANFIVLKDILSEILTGASSISSDREAFSNGGDNYYDIAINVDSIGDDYDVEQMADKVRDMIYEDSTYRNVNTINSVK